MGISAAIAATAYSGYQQGNLARKEARGAMRQAEKERLKAENDAALATNAEKATRKRNRSAMLLATGGSATSAMSSPVVSYGKTTTGQ